MKALFIILLFPLAFFGLVVASCQYLENPRSNFATYKEMEAAGMITAGWLPSYLPRSTINIKEGHNIDTNEVWASFEYSVGDTGEIEKVCNLIAESEIGKKFLCPPFDSHTTTVILRSTGTAYYQSYRNGI